MPNYNKVLLMGNLTRDVELKYTPGNMAVANLGIAVNRRYKGNDGEMKEETTFVDCEAWAQTAENLSKWFSKGRPIFLEGRLKLTTALEGLLIHYADGDPATFINVNTPGDYDRLGSR